MIIYNYINNHFCLTRYINYNLNRLEIYHFWQLIHNNKYQIVAIMILIS